MKEMKLGIFGLILLILTFLLFNMFVKIESGFVGIKSVFGKIDKNELEPGLHFISPIGVSVKEINVKVKTIIYKSSKGKISDSTKEGIINKSAITVLDKRGLPILIELSVLYSLNKKEAAETIIKYGNSWDEKLINPTVREIVRNVLGEYEAENIPDKRGEINNKIKQKLEEKLGKSSMIILNDVQLRNIELPKQVKQKILEVQMAKQEAKKQKYFLEKAKVQAETKVVNAKALADSKIATAKGEAESIKLKAQAQAQANKLINESINIQLIKYNYIKKWNGQLPSTMLSDKSNILLNLNSK